MMSTAFIKAVMDCYPECRVDLIVKSGLEKLPLPHRGKILPFDKSAVSAFSFGRFLSRYSYDRIYILPPSFSAAMMAFSASIPQRYGYRGNCRRLLLNPSFSYLKRHRSQHLVAEYLQLLEHYDEFKNYTPGLVITESWLHSTLQDLPVDLPDSFIVFAPGAVYGPAKQWPVDYFKQLAALLANVGKYIVVIGTKDDVENGEVIKNGKSSILNICGSTTLNQMTAVLARSDLLVSNDSGTMHVMAALQKPQIAIFGSTSTIWTSPLNKHACILKSDIECSPCFKRECPLGHYDCLFQIKPEVVFEKVCELLKSTDSK